MLNKRLWILNQWVFDGALVSVLSQVILVCSLLADVNPSPFDLL